MDGLSTDSPQKDRSHISLTPDQTALIDAIRSAVGALDPGLDPNCTAIKQQVKWVGDRLTSPTFRVTVFAPFNYGKSTLLNALLGHRALPIDLIPTTGAAIRIVYGESLHTTIEFKNGHTVKELGTDILKQFAILDQNRRMRDDVVGVTVACAHPLLQGGMEFVDLPGTDDQEAQDALVRDYLLTADLVVQVLDGRKLMTLMEREQLRDWLLDRGIDQVIFVVNFLNLLEPEDQKEVTRRLRFVASNFRANLPPTISNLYRVDALPALRARLKGDSAMVQTTGLPALETALQTLGLQPTPQIVAHRLPRVFAIAPHIQQSLQSQIQVLESVVKQASTERDRQKIAILQKAQGLIQTGFDKSVADLRQWIGIDRLLVEYKAEAVGALRNLDFDRWVELALRPAWSIHQQTVTSWVHKACDFFDCPRPVALGFQFPVTPDGTLPGGGPSRSTTVSEPGLSSTATDMVTKGAVPTVVAGGLGFLFGGPVGAALLGGTSYMLEKLDISGDRAMGSSSSSTVWTDAQIEAWYDLAIQDYFRQFSSLGLVALNHYVTTANPVIHFPLPDEPTTVNQDPPQAHQLALLKACGDRLQETFNELEISHRR